MGYTNSPLVDYVRISPNKTHNRNHVIDTVTIHCVVGQVTVERLGEVFAPTSRQASSNYGIGLDGRIGMYVEEKDRSWCSSNAANDHRAITIEVASDTTHPYAVTDKAYAALIDLLTDICKRNGIKELKWSTNKSDRINHINGCNMTVHRDFAAKACPGDYLYNRHGQIADDVNKKLRGTSSPNSSSSATSSASTENTYTVVKGDTLSGIGTKLKIAWKTIAELNGIKSPYVINVGQVLKLPTSNVASSNGSATTSSASVTKIIAGSKLNLKNVNLYSSSSATNKASTKTGTYYVWSSDVVSNRIRITNSSTNIGESGQVTGWIDYEDAKKSL